MHALGPGADLLAAEEEVVGVGPRLVGRVQHGVEGPDGRGVPVDDEEVHAVLFFDELSQEQLVRAAQVVAALWGVARVPQELQRVREVQHDRRIADDDGLGRELRPYAF